MAERSAGARASRRRAKLGAAAAAAFALVLVALPAAATAQLPDPSDPRVGLAPGLANPGVASKGVDLTAHRDRPAGFFNPANPGDFGFLNSDLAIQDDVAFVGGFRGWHAWDISDPENPTLEVGVVCPGGQGDPSVYGNLLFLSYENPSRIDCGTQAETSDTAFRGVRIFDISDLANPVQVAAVQTCRGSHTHTLVTEPEDAENVYVYNSGTSGVRSANHVGRPANCFENGQAVPQASRWSIDVIKVPLAAPQTAAIVSQPRLFANPETGAIDGLQNSFPTPLHPSGMTWSPQPITDACHDITAYPAIGLAAGACEGNGILIDISDPANPVRVDAVADPNYAYWHSATFNNDGTKVVFTDEWGGGTTARCRVNDRLAWGANAIYDIVDGKMRFRSYFKMPAVQTNQENCVAHNGSLVPVPGRDLLSQAWYQGGHTLLDFTDSANPKEIAFYDRGPISGTSLVLGGLWATYWYNGHTIGTELARGLDVFSYTPTTDLSANEIQAASEVIVSRVNAQHQQRISWSPSFAVVRSHLDQLVRADAIGGETLAAVTKHLEMAENATQGKKAKGQLTATADKLGGSPAYDALRGALLDLAATY